MGAMEIAGPRTSIRGLVIGVSTESIWISSSRLELADEREKNEQHTNYSRADTVDADVVFRILQTALEGGIVSKVGRSMLTSMASHLVMLITAAFAAQ
jgi:hypothetical protein